MGEQNIKRYSFKAKCPGCGFEDGHLFTVDQAEAGDQFVDCSDCGEPYVISLKLEPKVSAVCRLVLVEES